MKVADEQPGKIDTIKARGKNKRGQKFSFADIGLGSMSRCSDSQIQAKRQEVFKAVIQGMKEVSSSGLISFKLGLSEAAMPHKFKTKASNVGVADMDVRVSKKKFKKSGSGKAQCEEADVDLRDAGAYDVVMESVDDDALACVGKRPISKLVKKSATSYHKYCWTGNAMFGSWSPAEMVQTGDEYTCGKFEFFVQSMAVVSDGATDAPTMAPTLAPTPSWFLMDHNGGSKAVQCAGDNQVMCASDNGVTCGQYSGEPWDTIGTNDAPVVSNDSPVIMTCPGWISSSGKDPCHELDCYSELEVSQLSGGSPVYTTKYNMGTADDESVYKCNHGHHKCAVNTPGSRSKFTEVAPADMPDNLIFVPAEDFTASLTDGSFKTEGNLVIYKTADTRTEHHMPFAHPSQQ